MKSLLLSFLLLYSLMALSQKHEEFFNISFKPSKRGAYYYVVTEKGDSLWNRQAYYLTQKSQAMEGSYKDEACKIEHGAFKWFHTNRSIKLKGFYVDGKKEGVWLSWNDKGLLTDSSNYNAGHRTGISMHWHDNGMARDSLDFDGAGNGVQVSWFDDGHVASAGRWTNDTSKKGRWKYYHKNGQVMATEDYNNGKKIACACYDETAVQLDSALCIEKEAVPAGGISGWRKFLEKGMGQLLESKANSREWSAGEATVIVRFVVEKDGSLSEFTPLTQYGKGIEEEVIKMLRRAPKWTPGQQWGRPVKSYHTQPITLTIQSQ